MQGLDLITAGEFIDEAYAISLPAMRGVDAIHLTSGSVQRAARNFAPGGLDGVIHGTPGESSGYLSFTGLSAFLETQIADTAEQTIYTIVRNTSGSPASDTEAPSFYGNYGSGNIGVALYLQSSTQNWRQNNAHYTDAGQTTRTPLTVDLTATSEVSASDWQLLAIRIYEDRTVLENKTLNVTKTSQTNTFGRALSGLPFRFGSSHATYAGTCDGNSWVHANLAHTESEVADNVARLRTMASQLFGITV